MAKPRRRSADSADGGPLEPTGEEQHHTSGPAFAQGAETTGRFIVVFRRFGGDAAAKSKALLANTADLKSMATMADYEEGSAISAAGEENLFLDKLGMAVVTGDPEQMTALSAASAADDDGILAVEPEVVNYPIGFEPLSQFGGSFGGSVPGSFLPPEPEPPEDPGFWQPPATMSVALSLDYLRGYRDAFATLYAQLSGTPGTPGFGTVGPVAAEALAATTVFRDTADFTWGLQATGVPSTNFTGQGVRVAVLDTGLDLQHPDFRNRGVVARSFIAGAQPQDLNGHGTHCSGTVCGPLRPTQGPRYGVAHNAELFFGRVFEFRPNLPPRFQWGAPDGAVLAGIQWAIDNGCRVVSLSLGSQAAPSQRYEQAGQRALEQRTLIVAAAGNESERDRSPPLIRPVGSPANCDSIVAVAALDSRLRVARFSNRGSSSGGGKINMAGPGVAVRSSWIGGYNTISGTSMATPHIAGLVALWCEALPEASALEIFRRIVTTARTDLATGTHPADVGSGLAQSPLRV